MKGCDFTFSTEEEMITFSIMLVLVLSVSIITLIHSAPTDTLINSQTQQVQENFENVLELSRRNRLNSLLEYG